MREQGNINTRQWDDTDFDKTIQGVLGRDFALPKEVEEAKEEAFAQIRAMGQKKQAEGELKKNSGRPGKGRGHFWKGWAGLTASVAAFLAVCITNPAFAAKIPLVGHVFQELGDSLGFSGDYGKYAKKVEAPSAGEERTKEESEGYTQSSGGIGITLSETYCSSSALYLSLILKSEEGFPDTMIDQDGSPILCLEKGVLKTDFSDQEFLLHHRLDGRFIDQQTFAGVLRYDLSDMAQVREDGTVIKPEIPESFHVTIKAARVVGYKAVSTMPQMPEDIRDAYETAMKEEGMGLTDEDYEGFTQEQKEIERRLYTEMMEAYNQRYPEAAQYPNDYENWWKEGSWEFDFDVSRDERDTVTVSIDDVNEDGVGLVSVTRTPFEITIQDGQNPDTFTVALDADGDILPYGGSGDANTYAIQDRDVSRIDVYICDYLEYMDELKGYYWSEDYEEKKKTKTFGELLNERALYHKEIVFD